MQNSNDYTFAAGTRLDSTRRRVPAQGDSNRLDSTSSAGTGGSTRLRLTSSAGTGGLDSTDSTSSAGTKSQKKARRHSTRRRVDAGKCGRLNVY